MSVHRAFTSIDDLVNDLHIMHCDSVVSNYATTSSATPIFLNIEDASLADIITKIAYRFGYQWHTVDQTIYFTHSSPLPQSTWHILKADKTIKNTLHKWCSASNYQLIWDVAADYPIFANWSISHASFESAISTLIYATHNTDTPLNATIYAANRVLLIRADQ